jgi:hypothetical protein
MPGNRASSWSMLHLMGKRHRVIPDYTVTAWRKAFGIVDGEHLKTRLDVLEPGCAQLWQLGICLLISNWAFGTISSSGRRRMGAASVGRPVERRPPASNSRPSSVVVLLPMQICRFFSGSGSRSPRMGADSTDQCHYTGCMLALFDSLTGLIGARSCAHEAMSSFLPLKTSAHVAILLLSTIIVCNEQDKLPRVLRA